MLYDNTKPLFGEKGRKLHYRLYLMSNSCEDQSLQLHAADWKGRRTLRSHEKFAVKNKTKMKTEWYI